MSSPKHFAVTDSISVPRLPTLLLAMAAFVAVAAMGFAMPRSPGIEESTVFNAVFTYAQDGLMSFPVYGNAFLHSFGIHPHTHYGVLGLLISAGASLYSAEGSLIVIDAAIALLLITAGGWPQSIKAGLIVGLVNAIALATTLVPDSAFSVRPELDASLLFLCGLLAFQSARMRQLPRWPNGLIAAGAFLVTYSSTLQNFATFNFAAAIVYGALLLRDLPNRVGLRKLLVIVLAGSIVGVPYLLFYVFPNWEMMKINMAWGQSYSAPLSLKWQAYFDVARIALAGLDNNVQSLILAGAVRATYALSIPLGLVTLVLFTLHRSTRAMAIACLPPFIVIFMTLPKLHYFLAEYVLFLSAFWCSVFRAAGYLLSVSKRLQFARARTAQAWLLAISAALLVLAATPTAALRSSPFPPHEVFVARGAARTAIDGPGIVASRHVGWYMSGAARWYRIESDLTEPKKLCQNHIKPFLRQFDTIVDYLAFSDETANGITLSSLYADGVLSMKGFYLGQRLRGIDPIYLTARSAERVTGFLMKDDVLLRFDSNAAGDVIAATILRDRTVPLKNAESALSVRDITYLPPGIHEGVNTVTLVLASRSAWSQIAGALAPPARVRENITGTLARDDADALARIADARTDRITFIPYLGSVVTPLSAVTGQHCDL